MSITKTVFQYNLAYPNPGKTGWVDFPKAPSKFTKEMMQVVTESKRTVGKGAYLHKDLLAEKFKYNLTWYMLTPKELDDLEKIFKGHNFFSVRYRENSGFLDVTSETSGSVTNYYVVRTMYGGDQSAEAALVDPNTGLVRFYLNVTWNLIER